MSRKNIVFIRLSNTHSLRYPLEVLEHILSEWKGTPVLLLVITPVIYLMVCILFSILCTLSHDPYHTYVKCIKQY